MIEAQWQVSFWVMAVSAGSKQADATSLDLVFSTGMKATCGSSSPNPVPSSSESFRSSGMATVLLNSGSVLPGGKEVTRHVGELPRRPSLYWINGQGCVRSLLARLRAVFLALGSTQWLITQLCLLSSLKRR